jgi:hypothetical protein
LRIKNNASEDIGEYVSLWSKLNGTDISVNQIREEERQFLAGPGSLVSSECHRRKHALRGVCVSSSPHKHLEPQGIAYPWFPRLFLGHGDIQADI